MMTKVVPSKKGVSKSICRILDDDNIILDVNEFDATNKTGRELITFRRQAWYGVTCIILQTCIVRMYTNTMFRKPAIQPIFHIHVPHIGSI